MEDANEQLRIRLILKGKPPQEYSSTRVLVGRSEKADFQVHSDIVSRQHLEVFISSGALWVKDLGSNNGTYIDNVRIPANQPIRCRNVQTISLGEQVLMQASIIENDAGKQKEPSNPNLPLFPEGATRVQEAIIVGGQMDEEAAVHEKTIVWNKDETLATENQKLREVINNLTLELNEALQQKHQSPEDEDKREAALSAIHERVQTLQAELESVRGSRNEEIKKFEAWKREKQMEMRRTELDVKAHLHEKELEKADLIIHIKELNSKKALEEKELQVLERSREKLIEEEERLRSRGKQLTEAVKKNEAMLGNLQEEASLLTTAAKETEGRTQELTQMAESKLKEIERLKSKEETLQLEIEKANTALNEAKMAVAEEHNRLLDEAQKDATETRQKAAAEAKEIVQQMKEYTARELAREKEQAQKDTEKLLQEKRQRAEKEIEKNLEEAAQQLRNRREEEEKEAKQWRKRRIKSVTVQIEQSLADHLDPILKRHGEAEKLPFLLKSVRPVVEKAFLLSSPAPHSTSSAPTASLLRRSQVSLFLVTLTLSFSLIYLLGRGDALKNFFLRPLSKTTASSEGRSAEQRGLASRTGFKPVQDAEYKSNFVDNVVYTAYYVDIKLDDQIQKQWVAELSHFFSTSLHKDEAAMVKYFTVENTLVRRLIEMRSALQAGDQKNGLTPMRQVEQTTVKEMVDLAGGTTNYHLLRGLERSFFQRVLKERATASVAFQPKASTPESLSISKTPSNDTR